MTNNPKIGFCGMSHLGITSSIAAVSKGFRVICFDPDQSKIKRLEKGDLIIFEPHLDDAYNKNIENICFTDNITKLLECDLIYISQDVVTDDYGNSIMNDLDELIELIKPHIRIDAILVILSQVPPGYSRLKKESLNLYYQVETLIFGDAFNRAMYPERYIIGGNGESDELPYPLRVYLKAYNCPIFLMSYESAELAKISINLMLISSLSMANMISNICENIGADWNDITKVLKLDKRIGQNAYIKTGLGFSGGNLERDLVTIQKVCKSFSISNDFFENIAQINNYQRNWPYQKLISLFDLNNQIRIAILGMTYKENTNSVKNSPVIELLNKLEGCNVIVYDPIVNANKYIQWCEVASSLADACLDADVVLIMTPWKEFQSADINYIISIMRGNIIIDPHNIVNTNDIEHHNIKVLKAGRPVEILLP